MKKREKLEVTKKQFWDQLRLTIFILIIICWINHHWWVSGAWYWLLSFRLHYPSELGISWSGERGSWGWSWFLVWLFVIFAQTWENYSDYDVSIGKCKTVLKKPAFESNVCQCKRLLLTSIRWDEDAVDVARLFMEEGTVWLLAACWLVFPVTSYLLSVFLLWCSR